MVLVVLMLTLVAAQVVHLHLLLLREIVWHLLLLHLLLSSVEGVPVHVWSLTCRYLEPLDFFSQGIIQSISKFSLFFHGLQSEFELPVLNS